MSEAPFTRPSLLLAIRDPADGEAWRQFVQIYTPLIFHHCLKYGLQQADAADVAQEVMKAVAQAIRKFDYDRSRGCFRGWLLTVTRSKLNNFFAARARQPHAAGETTVHAALEAEPSAKDRETWETDYRRRLFDVAAERVRPEFQEKTWQAFWRTSVRAEGASEVAGSLGLSVGAVYIARSRVLARLRECLETISEESDLLDPARP